MGVSYNFIVLAISFRLVNTDLLRNIFFIRLFRTSSMFYDFGYTGNRQSLLPQNSVVWVGWFCSVLKKNI